MNRTIRQQKGIRAGIEYTDEFEAELTRRHTAYKDGSEKPVTASDSKRRIQKLLRSARK